MRTRSQSRNNFPQKEASLAIVDPFRIELPFLEDQFQEDPPEDPPEVPMADNQTMTELLQAPTEGYEDAIVIPENTANNFELKHVVAKVSTSSSTPAISSDVAELKDMVRALLLDKKNQSSATALSPTPAPVKVVEPNYVTCGGAHSYHNCPATSGNDYRDNIQEYVAQAAAANYNQGNTGFRPQMVTNQIQPPGFPPVKANDAVLRNMQDQGQNVQNQCQSLQIQMANLTDMLSKFVSSNTAPSSGSGTLPSNTITNPKEELKGITTRSGVAYQGPIIPTPSKVVKQGTKLVVAPVSAPMPNLKPSIPYPLRRDNERRRMDECLALADLGASINLMPLSVWEALSLPKLTPTCMTLELTDRSVSKPIGITKDVSVKV
nr:reverse transcriptase domain-containing protein [Tanacetum cinerariifolium]